MRNGETCRNGCTKTKRTHKRKPPNLALPLGELAKISDFRLRGAASGRRQFEPATLAVDPCHWGSPGSIHGARPKGPLRHVQWPLTIRVCYPGSKPTPLGVTRFVTERWTENPSPPSVRTGHLSQRERQGSPDGRKWGHLPPCWAYNKKVPQEIEGELVEN